MAKALIDLSAYVNTLPSDSQIYGVYQPILGWKGQNSKNRFQPDPSSLDKMVDASRQVLTPHFKNNQDARRLLGIPGGEADYWVGPSPLTISDIEPAAENQYSETEKPSSILVSLLRHGFKATPSLLNAYIEATTNAPFETFDPETQKPIDGEGKFIESGVVLASSTADADGNWAMPDEFLSDPHPKWASLGQLFRQVRSVFGLKDGDGKELKLPRTITPESKDADWQALPIEQYLSFVGLYVKLIFDYMNDKAPLSTSTSANVHFIYLNSHTTINHMAALILSEQSTSSDKASFVSAYLEPFDTPSFYDSTSGAPNVYLTAVMRYVIDYESRVAGVIAHLIRQGKFDQLRSIFFPDSSRSTDLVTQALDTAGAVVEDHFSEVKQFSQIPDLVALSPIGVVHLFRQYFFELDTFVGEPVGHVWVPPGSSVELMETSSRQTTVEKSVETDLSKTNKSDQSNTTKSELSTAVKEENKSDISIAASVSASGGIANICSGSASASTNYNTSQSSAREQAHKEMRQQTQKISAEVKSSFKTSFKTTTSTTDTSSKRYVLTNTSNELKNYEMRRKMRQIGIQVQDIGSYLCWQSYVDSPGDDLGVSNLLYFTPPEGQPLPDYPQPPAQSVQKIKLSFLSWQNNKLTRRLAEVSNFEFPGFTLGPPSGNPTEISPFNEEKKYGYPMGDGVVRFEIDNQTDSYKYWVVRNDQGATIYAQVDTNGDDHSVPFTVTVTLTPSQDVMDAYNAKLQTAISDYNTQAAMAKKKYELDCQRSKVDLASKISPRKFEDLRAEERSIIYRHLISGLVSGSKKTTWNQANALGTQNISSSAAHRCAELINSIFDVEKMLYFVTPDWWAPRKYGAAIKSKLPGQGTILQDDEVTNLGDTAAGRYLGRDYLITENSAPAPMGASLGWVLQLDGDNMRNAFLNSPWVKTVMPIRPGRELDALRWVQLVEGSEGVSDDDIYTNATDKSLMLNGKPYNGAKMIDVLQDLATRISQKSATSTSLLNCSIGNATLTTTPINRVYEFGFDPLKGGFKGDPANMSNFEVFDQWVEIMPTDQIVALEVKYDPKTGRQV